MYIAHRDDHENEQSLEEHLFNVAFYCKETGKAIELEYFLLLIGLLHDLGKSDPFFQDYIRGNKKIRVNHSSAGGRYIFEELGKNAEGIEKIMVEIMEYIIYSHHGLFDVIHPENQEYVLKKRRDYDKAEQYHYYETVVPFVESINQVVIKKIGMSLENIFQEACKEFRKLLTKLIKITPTKNPMIGKNSFAYYMHCIVRLGLSILKEGDIFDSANVFLNEKTKRITEEEMTSFWEESQVKVEELAEKFSKSSEGSQLNKNRTALSEQLYQSSLYKKSGVFKLEMPTGSGKTQASLRYAVNNVKKYNSDRVFYITAFLSVLEQNANEIKKTLSDSTYILEHHSNIVRESMEDQNILRKEQYLIDSWESPFVLTTMVQFFQTMFKGKASNIRRFHRFINSVIIVDEVQSLPIKVIYHFNLMMNFMSSIMNANIILCSATQPILDSPDLDYPIFYTKTDNQTTNLALLDEQMKNDFNRIEAINLIEDNNFLSTHDIFEMVEDDLKKYDSILIILNTKSAVEKLYENLKDRVRAKIIYLTTNLCAAHRLAKIEKIKKHLEKNKLIKNDKKEKIVVISTQLVEAGVDFDFNIVYRSLAGADSLVQAAGRCNRSGILPKGIFKVFLFEEENLTRLKEIVSAREAGLYALRENNVLKKGQKFDLESLQIPYYEKYFANQTNQMGFALDDGNTLLDLLGYNKEKRESCDEIKNSNLLAQSFSKASTHFDLIDEKHTTVIVPFKDSLEDINEIKEKIYESLENYNFSNVRELTKLLQPYTIQVYDKSNIINYVEGVMEDKIYFLLPEYYDDEIGLNVDELQLLLS